MKRIVACIGRRDATSNQILICEAVGEWLVQNDWVIRSGNSPGADQAYARGANKINPRMVGLALPWPGFERSAIVAGNKIELYRVEWEEFAKRYHPGWEECSPSARKLLARNWAIIMGRDGNRAADFVLAVRTPDHSGGTEHAIRIAEGYGIPVIDISEMGFEEIVFAVQMLTPSAF